MSGEQGQGLGRDAADMADAAGPVDAVDVLAVTRSDDVLHQLGARSRVLPREPVVSLLRSLVEDVDADLAQLLENEAAAAPAVPAARRGHAARGTTLALVLAGTLSVSGVAAAVTGDPLAPYRAVLSFGEDEPRKPPPRGTTNQSVRRAAPALAAAPFAADRETPVGRAVLGSVPAADRARDDEKGAEVGKAEKAGKAGKVIKDSESSKGSKPSTVDKPDTQKPAGQRQAKRAARGADSRERQPTDRSELTSASEDQQKARDVAADGGGNEAPRRTVANSPGTSAQGDATRDATSRGTDGKGKS